MEYFSLLPSEITLDILTRLPTESILECKPVCKTWTSLVGHPFFTKMHLDHHNHSSSGSGKLGFLALTGAEKFYYFEYNDENHDQAASPIERITRINFTPPFKGFRFVGSSAGLICLARGRSVCICNPITREIFMLPDTNLDIYWIIGFGYASSINEYKIVGMCTSQTRFREIHVYTLGSGKGWRNLTSNFYIREKGVFANGDLYWIDARLVRIITYDLAKEKFSEHLLPPDLDSGWNMGFGFGWVFEGFLCFGINLDAGGEGLNEACLLNPKNANHESLVWSKEFRIDKITKFVDIVKRDAVLTYDYYHLNLYDTKTSTPKRLMKLKDCIHQVYPHKNTLVSLKELMEEDTKGMTSVGIEETQRGAQ